MSSSNSCSEVLEMNSGLFPVDSKVVSFRPLQIKFPVVNRGIPFPVLPSFTSIILTHSSDLLFNQLIQFFSFDADFCFHKIWCVGMGGFRE